MEGLSGVRFCILALFDSMTALTWVVCICMSAHSAAGVLS